MRCKMYCIACAVFCFFFQVPQVEHDLTRDDSIISKDTPTKLCINRDISTATSAEQFIKGTSWCH